MIHDVVGSITVFVFQDELIETVVLPHLANIDQDSDSEVQPAAVTLLVDLAHTSQTHRCMEILELLKKVGHEGECM